VSLFKFGNRSKAKRQRNVSECITPRTVGLPAEFGKGLVVLLLIDRTRKLQAMTV